MAKKKFAWLPRIIDTWRSNPTRMLIWLQSYYVSFNDGPYFALNSTDPIGQKKVYALHRGFCAFEYQGYLLCELWDHFWSC